MRRVVVDTNVLLVANGRHKDASPECVLACTDRLEALQKSGCVVLDAGGRILEEYRKKTHPNQPKGPGDVFLKWLLRNTENDQRVEKAVIHETGKEEFDEFPLRQKQHLFDRTDRKFVAVANAHSEKPAIWEAVDCKWLNWWRDLAAQGIRIEFLCPDDICRFYTKKFPKKKCPDLP